MYLPQGISLAHGALFTCPGGEIAKKGGLKNRI
jgi:hypothetical protein